jgi:FkbM family methyltransferase
MKKQLKKWWEFLQITLIPGLYKKRYFNTLEHLTWKSIMHKNIENEILLIKYFMNKDFTFIDIGANLGQYLYVTEKIVNKKNIHAFEPHPALNKRLAKIFKGINIHPFAISNNNENTTFKIPFLKDREIHTRGTLKTDYIDSIATTYKLIDVKVVKLDSIASKLNLQKNSFIKIDVEGAEIEVIEGANETIKIYKPIMLIEIEQQHHKDSIFSLISKIETSLHYKCYYFDTQEQLLKGDIHQQNIHQIQFISNHGLNRLFINNFIFLPVDQFDERKVESINQSIRKDVLTQTSAQY